MKKRENVMKESVAITTEYIKLDSFLKLAGATLTGGEAKTMIAEGSVLVNGEPCAMRGKKLRPGDAVTFTDRSDRFEVVAAP